VVNESERGRADGQDSIPAGGWIAPSLFAGRSEQRPYRIHATF